MPADAPSSSTASGVHGEPNTWVPTSTDAPSSRVAASARSSWQVVTSHSANRGTAPAQRAAWAVAEKVKLGITAAVPGRDSACSTSISPAVHDATATTWGTPSRAAAAASNSAPAGRW